MRVVQYAITEVDQYIEEARWAKTALDFERWRAELRPRVLRHFAARAARLCWSRALLRAVVEELHPDGFLTELLGDLDRIPPRKWPRVIAVAVALRRSWHQKGLEAFARDLCLSLPPTASTSHSIGRRSRPSRSDSSARLSPVKALRCASTPLRGAHGLDRTSDERLVRHLRDGRGTSVTRSGKEPCHA